MTYLDPNHARTEWDLGKLVLRLLAIAAVVGFGWFALTVGDSGTGPTPVVAEPATRAF